MLLSKPGAAVPSRSIGWRVRFCP